MAKPEAPMESAPRNWVDMRLANGIDHRIIYSNHSTRRNPSELGQVEAVGLEAAYYPTADSVHNFLNAVDRVQNHEYSAISRHAREEHLPLFFVDVAIPDDPIMEEIARIDAEKNAESGSINQGIAVISMLALVGANYMSKPKEHPTRRNVIQAAAAATWLAAVAPKIELAIATMAFNPGSVIDENSIARHAQKFFGSLGQAELRLVFGQLNFIREFRDFVMAEKIWRMSEIAKGRGITRTASICGGLHSGIEMALRMSSEDRMRTINQALQGLADGGLDVEVVDGIRRSIEVMFEANAINEKGWEVTRITDPSWQ